LAGIQLKWTRNDRGLIWSLAHLNETARTVSFWTTLFIFLLPPLNNNRRQKPFSKTVPPLSPRPHRSPTPLDHRTGHWPTSRCVIEGAPAPFFPINREENRGGEWNRREKGKNEKKQRRGVKKRTQEREEGGNFLKRREEEV